MSGTVTAVTENIYGVTNGDSTVSTQKGTQGAALSKDDYDSFTGSEYGHTANWSTSGYNTLTYNAQGISDVNGLVGSGEHKSCLREYTHDYLNSSSGTNNYRNGGYYSDDTSGTKDPYLYVTMGAGGFKTIKVGGVWKETTSQKIKVGGAWKAISNIKVKVSGVWKSAT